MQRHILSKTFVEKLIREKYFHFRDCRCYVQKEIDFKHDRLDKHHDKIRYSYIDDTFLDVKKVGLCARITSILLRTFPSTTIDNTSVV